MADKPKAKTRVKTKLPKAKRPMAPVEREVKRKRYA